MSASATSAAIDRHPELKSRAVAWTELDGSYLVDPTNRAEMLDFYWVVLGGKYPATGWTGSTNPPVPGQISELRRVREIAQINAYRAIVGSPPVSEDASKLDYVQAGALLIAQNPGRLLSHNTDPSWIGYNPTAADALANSLLAGYDDEPYTPMLGGPIDTFVSDVGTINFRAVGHRSSILRPGNVYATVGAAQIEPPVRSMASVVSVPFVASSSSPDGFVAWPSPGWSPTELFIRKGAYRWSFVTSSDWMAPDAGTSALLFSFAAGVPQKDAWVSAKLNGRPITVQNLIRNIPPGPLTWEFNLSTLDFETDRVPDDTAVEIEVHDMAELAPGSRAVVGYRDYTYTVRFFDPQIILPGAYSPKTALVNMSTRGTIGSGNNQLICGLSVEGEAPVRLALRTQGPSLAAYGLLNVARSTRLRLYDDAGNLIGLNEGWRGHPSWRLLQSYALSPFSDDEAAAVVTLWPGNYTAVVSDETGADGIGIIEAFNIDSQSPSRLVNVSTRGVVGAGESAMIAGVVIKDKPRTMLIRTQGPGLRRYGVTGTVMDTVLTVVAQLDGRTVGWNDDWGSEPTNAPLRSVLSPYAPTDDRESALVLTLAPGAYTALVTAKSEPGVGIVEVFDVTR